MSGRQCGKCSICSRINTTSPKQILDFGASEAFCICDGSWWGRRFGSGMILSTMIASPATEARQLQLASHCQRCSRIHTSRELDQSARITPRQLETFLQQLIPLPQVPIFIQKCLHCFVWLLKHSVVEQQSLVTVQFVQLHNQELTAVTCKNGTVL
jgi:hypothetical protein